MHNKVVHYLAKTFSELGMQGVRFNFRGVGASAGVYDEGRGEQDDLRAVIQWCRTRDAALPVWLAGFSFGAFVAAAVAAQEVPACLVSVAPPVHMFDFAEFTRPACPWVVVQGTDDEVVPFQAVKEWSGSLRPPPQLIIMEGASHFFHGRLNDLREQLRQALEPVSPGTGEDSGGAASGPA